tara:strand:+ start:1805 stop:2104 length:300 start_codon:yes stop_codon:yes gene_type:complete
MSKTLTQKSDNVSIYLMDNDCIVDIASNPKQTYITGSNVFNIANPLPSEMTLHENVTAPSDWAAHKYKFDGTKWSANSSYVEDTRTWTYDADKAMWVFE